jgi:hypothetical protein
LPQTNFSENGYVTNQYPSNNQFVILIRAGQIFYLFYFLPMIPLGYHGKKRRAGVLKKLNTHKFGDYNFFEMPALPKGKKILGLQCTLQHSEKLPRTLPMLLGDYPVWPVRTVGYISDE